MRPITAADLMNPEVLTVRDDATVAELARFLVDNEITGAPVEDADGRLVGVVSAVDLVRLIADDEEDDGEGTDGAGEWAGAAATGGEAGGAGEGEDDDPEDEGAGDEDEEDDDDDDPEDEGAGDEDEEDDDDDEDDVDDEDDDDGYELELPGEDLLVEDVMTPRVVSVSEDATVPEIARLMLHEHLHRLVVERDGRPVGILSTSDLLGLLVEEG